MTHHARIALAALVAATSIAGLGCSCGEGIPLPPASSAAPDEESPAITVVKLTAGEGSADATIAADAVPPGCAPGARPERAVQIGEDRGLADGIAWFRRGPQRGATTPVPPAPTQEQRLGVDDCRMTPRALAASRGDTLVVSNRDDRFHTVHLWRIDGGQERSWQTIALAPHEGAVRFTLDQPGLYRMRSDQIPWMRGLLLVHQPQERALITGSDGSAESTTLPLGSWTVQLVHESLGSTETSVDVVAGEPAGVYGVLPTE